MGEEWVKGVLTNILKCGWQDRFWTRGSLILSRPLSYPQNKRLDLRGHGSLVECSVSHISSQQLIFATLQCKPLFYDSFCNTFFPSVRQNSVLISAAKGKMMVTDTQQGRDAAPGTISAAL